MRKRVHYIYFCLVLGILSMSCEDKVDIPYLKEQLETGELPLLAQRLPDNPLIVHPYESTGKYGGELISSWFGIDDKWGVAKYTDEFLVMLSPDGSEVIENLIDHWDIRSDLKLYTLHLREGIKWSDGMDFTTKDILFFWEYVVKGPYASVLNRASWLQTQSNASLQVHDEYTFSIEFPQPVHQFMVTLATEIKDFFLPEHVYREILPIFCGDAQALLVAKKYGFADIEQFLDWIINYGFLFPGIPTLRPWVALNQPSETVFKMNRNPYYWKVDPLGNQLPYLDEIHFIKSPDTEIIQEQLKLSIPNFQHRHLTDIPLSWYQENVDLDFYQIIEFHKTYHFDNVISPNIVTGDPLLRQLFSDVRFREALSHAIDRSEFENTIEQVSVSEFSPFYSQTWSEKAVDFDPSRAKELLIALGLYYENDLAIRPDTGMPLVVHLDSWNSINPVLENVIQDLKDIGITAIFRSHSRQTYRDSLANGVFEIGIRKQFEPENLLFDPTELLPLRLKHGWAGSIGLYFESGGKMGTRPPEEVQRLYDVWAGLDGSEEDESRIREIYRIYEDNLWVISTTPGKYGSSYAMASKGLRNLESGLIESDFLRTPGNLRFYQVWMEY